MSKPIVFDRYGNCPMCGKKFLSDKCDHSYSQASRAVSLANQTLDVATVLDRYK